MACCMIKFTSVSLQLNEKLKMKKCWGLVKSVKREQQLNNINNLLKDKERQRARLDNYPVGEVNTATKTEPAGSQNGSEQPESGTTVAMLDTPVTLNVPPGPDQRLFSSAL